MIAPGWSEVRMGDGQIYYYNKELDTTQWERPVIATGDATRTSTGSQDLDVRNEINIGPNEGYQERASHFFDVTTDDIVQRLLVGLMPTWLWQGTHGASPDLFKVKPDFYGPFWLCQTLAFALFAAGHIYEYLYAGTLESQYGTLFVSWIFSNAWWLSAPLLLEMVTSADGRMELTSYCHALCCFGYALIPAILATVLCCLIPNKLLQIICALGACAYSVFFLYVNFELDLNRVKTMRGRMTMCGCCIAVQALYFLAIPFYFLTLPSDLVVDMSTVPASPAMHNRGGGALSDSRMRQPFK